MSAPGFATRIFSARWQSGAMRALAAVVVVVLLGGCDGGSDAQPAKPSPTRSTPRATVADPPSATPSTPSDAEPTIEPVRFSATAAMRTVRFLAGRRGVGPREATSPAYARAARWVEQQLGGYGYRVRRQHLRVPAGVSWGVPVPSGDTWNVIATPEGFRTDEPHLMVGAQLDTVPQAPGAEDNASGVSVLLEIARMAAQRPTRLPVMFVAFAAEEPRGDGEAWHHFGSRAYVQRMPPAERSALRGLANPDRVGVGRSVPICTGGLGTDRVKRSLLTHARRAGVPAHGCVNTTSDHWSFEQADMPAARLGGTDYPEYHSPADRPRVVRPIQLERTGRLIWAWLR
jgi:Peptidase family M28